MLVKEARVCKIYYQCKTQKYLELRVPSWNDFCTLNESPYRKHLLKNVDVLAKLLVAEIVSKKNLYMKIVRIVQMSIICFKSRTKM